MKNSKSITRISIVLILFAGFLTISCSTPKYYVFRKMTFQPSSTANVDSLAPLQLIPETKALSPPDINIQKPRIAELSMKKSIASTQTDELPAVSPPVSRKAFKKELKKIIKGDPAWNQMASIKKDTVIANSNTLVKNEDERPTDRLAIISFLLPILSWIFPLLFYIPGLYMMIAVDILTLILGFIAIGNLKKTGQKGMGFAIASIFMAALVLLILLV